MATANIYDLIDSQVKAYSVPVGGPPLAQASRLVINTVADNLTAKAGGGQSGATPITTSIARFTTVATANDSAVLPAAVAGMEAFVINSGAAALAVFAPSGQSMNGTLNGSASVPAGKSASFISASDGNWYSFIGN